MRTYEQLVEDLDTLEQRMVARREGYRKQVARECAELAWDRLVRSQGTDHEDRAYHLMNEAYRALTRGHVNLNMED